MVVNEKKKSLNETVDTVDIINKFNSFAKSEYWAIFINNSNKTHELDCEVAFIKDEQPIFSTKVGFGFYETDYHLNQAKNLPYDILNDIDSVMRANYKNSRYDIKDWELACEKCSAKKVMVICVD